MGLSSAVSRSWVGDLEMVRNGTSQPNEIPAVGHGSTLMPHSVRGAGFFGGDNDRMISFGRTMSSVC